MMDFQMIDMIVVGLILFLAIKGLVNGFGKELFNLLGLIGGIFVAARMSDKVGALVLEQKILPEIATDYQKIIGFLALFFAIWTVVSLVSSVVSKFGLEEPSIISRIFGYILGAVRYAFVFSLILYGFNNADFLKEKFSKYTQGSQVFDPMVTVGAKLLCLDNNRTAKKAIDLNSTTVLEESNSSNATIISSDLNITLTEHNSTSN
jgi:membrane protein required for colicin V production